MTDSKIRERAFFFVDGNNWYHALVENGVKYPSLLSYSSIFEKLAMDREWVGSRYYIGALNQSHDPKGYAEQRQFLAALRAEDPRIEVKLGRIEKRPFKNELKDKLLDFLAGDDSKGLPDAHRQALSAMNVRYGYTEVLKEKAVDVHLAVDMIALAHADAFDVAYLLSADGDFTPAVDLVLGLGKKVLPVSPNQSMALRRACGGVFIRLRQDWFNDCRK